MCASSRTRSIATAPRASARFRPTAGLKSSGQRPRRCAPSRIRARAPPRPGAPCFTISTPAGATAGARRRRTSVGTGLHNKELPMSHSPSRASADTQEMPSQTDLAYLAAKYFGAPPTPMRLEFGARSHPGRVRTNNEVHYNVVRRRRTRDVLLTNLPEGYLPQIDDDSFALAVADGIGGAAFGELASMFALRAGWDLTSRAYKWHFRLSDREMAELMEMVQVYGQLIHQKLRDLAKADPSLAGMGTTITAALIVGSNAVIGHVGDSRAYHWRAGSLRRLTRDHTRAQAMVDFGVFESIEDAPKFMRHVLINCLGGSTAEVDVDVHHVALEPGDRLLLCTDGLTDMIDDNQVAQVLQTRPAADDACQALVDLALEHGGRDNVTVVLANVK